MNNQDINAQLDVFGEQAAHLLAKTLASSPSVRIWSTPERIGESWTIRFYVLLSDQTSYIEFTAVQTGWGGPTFVATHESLD